MFNKTRESILKHYVDKKESLHEGMKHVEVQKQKALVKLAKEEYAYTLAQKHSAEQLEKDLLSDIISIKEKIAKLNEKKKSAPKKPSKDYVQLKKMMEKLRDQIKPMQKKRKELMKKESAKLKLVKAEIKKAKLNDRELQDVEKTVTYLLSEASFLLGKESLIVGSDVLVLEKIKKRELAEIRCLNKEIRALHKTKRELLLQVETVQSDEKNFEKMLKSQAKKEKMLEGKLERAIKRVKK